MKKFFLQFLDKYTSKNDFSLKNYDFSFLDFSNEENSKDIFYLEKIEVVNFFECENTIILDNSTWNNSYDELLSIWIFWFEKFVYLTDLLFLGETNHISIIDCLNITSRSKKHNYLELSLHLRDDKTQQTILIKRVFKNIDHNAWENNFYYYENEHLITTESVDKKILSKFITIKNYSRVFFLAQIFYNIINIKNYYEKEFAYLKNYQKNYEAIEYKILKNNYITKYNQVCKDEADILKVLSKYNKEKLYQVMDYIHNHSKKNTRSEVQNNGEWILNFLHNIWFTHISQKQANQIFTHIDSDILRYGLYFPISDLFLYFYLFWYKTNNQSFENFIYFFNKLLTWDKNLPIDIENIDLYKKSSIQTPYNTHYFWDYVKTTLLDKNGNINMKLLEYRFS